MRRLYGIPLRFLVMLANQISHQRANSNDCDCVEYGDQNTVSIQCHVCHPGSSLSQVSFYGSLANQISHQRANSNDCDCVEYGDQNTVSIQCHVCHPGSSLSQVSFYGSIANQISHQRANSNDCDCVEYGDQNTVSIQCHVCHPGSSLSQVSFYGSIVSYSLGLCKCGIYALRCRAPRISSSAPGCSSTACTYRSGILEQFSMPKSVTGRKPKRL